MKAAFIDRYGSNDRVRVADIAVPLMGPLDLLVQVHAASVNPLDVKARDGQLKLLLKHQFLEHADGRRVEASGSLNEALCRAAVKAVGQ